MAVIEMFSILLEQQQPVSGSLCRVGSGRVGSQLATQIPSQPDTFTILLCVHAFATSEVWSLGEKVQTAFVLAPKCIEAWGLSKHATVKPRNPETPV
jgi:hypothetical protein